MPNYTHIILPKETRTDEDSCNCFVSLTGKYKGHSKIEKGKGHKNDSVRITTENGLYSSLKNVNLPKKVQVNDTLRSSISMCNLCLQEVGRGKSHPCITPAQCQDNVLKFVGKLPENRKSKLLIRY